jgi:zinc finger protein
MGSRFTTVEGILTEIRDQLSSTIYDIEDTAHSGCDILPTSEKEKWNSFFSQLEKAINGDIKFVMTLVDPLANSYVQDLGESDPQLKVEEYISTEKEEDDLGLKDMKTEGYENEAEEEKKEQSEENC